MRFFILSDLMRRCITFQLSRKSVIRNAEDLDSFCTVQYAEIGPGQYQKKSRPRLYTAPSTEKNVGTKNINFSRFKLTFVTHI